MSLTLSYPYASPTTSVVLPNQVLGDTTLIRGKLILHPMMDGSLVTYKKTPSTRAVIYSIQNVNNTVLDAFFAFLVTTRGKEIKMVNSAAETWRGMITNNTVSAVSERRPNSCVTDLYDLTFEFEGAIQ